MATRACWALRCMLLLPCAAAASAGASPPEPPRFAEDDIALGYVVPEDPALLREGPSLQSETAGAITHIGTFLDRCPTTDPIYAQLRSDFTLLREGLAVGAVACSEPVSSLPVAQYTDELISLQVLRTIYYMDLGGSGHLPWTGGSLYQWMKSKIGGIDIRAGLSYCCEYIGDKVYIVVSAQNDREIYKSWRGISGYIALYTHETRHVDGFPHVSCCGFTNGCDDSYDEANLSPYGIQYFLNRAWLRGDINVGFACLSSSEQQEIAYQHFYFVNSVFAKHFCNSPPPTVSMPAQPGGACPATACAPGPTQLCLNASRFRVALQWTPPGGAPSAGQAVSLTPETGYFFFVSSSNVEVVVKVIKACGLNNRYWVFAAGLTNVRTVITVTDTKPGISKTYINPQGKPFQPVQDTAAFATCP